ncbi:hypothetical protein AV649_00945 [Rossellomorea marisflavi]|uniref:Uncharacterized protein n=1 Tax=Rossellomorea marisflavi TaxID=189381 RepID=A0A163LCV5_9BACI|nr:hypothetical protein AV649_00945 [Rossellomorea marisflavi]
MRSGGLFYAKKKRTSLTLVQKKGKGGVSEKLISNFMLTLILPRYHLYKPAFQKKIIFFRSSSKLERCLGKIV